MYCVYRHTTPSGKVYIGITKQEQKTRWQNGRGYITNIVFYRAIKKYGWDNIDHEILLEGLTEEDAKEAEVYLIAKHNATDRRYGYNITKGGDHGASRPRTEEEKQRAREAWTGSGNPNARPVICLETLDVYETAVEAQKATGASKVCDCAKRIKKHRTSGGYHWAYYDPDKPIDYYVELLDKYIAEESAPTVVSELARKLTSERSSVQIRCLETGKVYPSLRAAAKEYGISSAGICNCCKGKNHTAGGHHWAYYDPSKPDGHYSSLLDDLVKKESMPRILSEKQLHVLRERSNVPVRCIETGKLFPSQVAAQAAMGIGKSDISACCRGRQKTAGGFHWAYA